MLLENGFTVPVPADRLWSHLLDVEAIAPCLPGAELTETVDDRTWKGTVAMKLGPVTLSFAGTVALDERDDLHHRLVLRATGMEQRGKGAVTAVVTGWLEPEGAATAVRLRTELQLTGAVAQMSRGLLPEVSRKLTDEFAACLQASMLARSAGSASAQAVPQAGAPAKTPAGPIGGIRLALSAAWSGLVRFVRRIVGRAS